MLKREMAPFSQDLRVLDEVHLVRRENLLDASAMQKALNLEPSLPPAIDDVALGIRLDACSLEDFFA